MDFKTPEALMKEEIEDFRRIKIGSYNFYRKIIINQFRWHFAVNFLKEQTKIKTKTQDCTYKF